MSYTTPSTTVELSLDAVVERLQRHPDVDGLVLIGSAKSNRFDGASDYDLLIVLTQMAIQTRVGVTYVDHRLCDLLFATREEVDAMLVSELPFNGESWMGRIARWCQTGSILFDRSGRLTQLKQKVTAGEWIGPAEELARYQIWFSINYNFWQTRRMSQSHDPVYQLAVQMRLLYSLSDLLGGYFTLRQLLWPGEKGAIHYLTEHDPHFLALFTESLQESNLDHLLALYEQLVLLAIAPYGERWAEEATVFQLDEPTSALPSEAQRLLNWWQSLLEGEPTRPG
jgi:hypothetical protein